MGSDHGFRKKTKYPGDHFLCPRVWFVCFGLSHARSSKGMDMKFDDMMIKLSILTAVSLWVGLVTKFLMWLF